MIWKHHFSKKSKEGQLREKQQQHSKHTDVMCSHAGFSDVSVNSDGAPPQTTELCLPQFFLPEFI